MHIVNDQQTLAYTISFPVSFPQCTFSKSILCSSQHSRSSILMCCTMAVATSVSLFGVLRPAVKGSPWLLSVSQFSPKLGTSWHSASEGDALSYACPAFPPAFLFFIPEEGGGHRGGRELTFSVHLWDKTLYLLDALFPLSLSIVRSKDL